MKKDVMRFFLLRIHKWTVLSLLRNSLMVILMFVTTDVGAQVNIDVDDVQKINPAKKYKPLLKELRQKRKELKKNLKKFENLKSKDSAFVDVLESFSDIQAMVKERAEAITKSYQNQLQQELTANQKRKWLIWQQRWNGAKDDWENYAVSDSSLRAYWDELKTDSLLLNRAEEELTQYVKNQLGEDFAPGTKDASELARSRLGDMQGFSDPSESYRQLTKDAFNLRPNELENVDPKQILGPLADKGDIVENAHNQAWKLKQKYSYIGNSNDMSSAIRDRSMVGSPFGKRLRLGGNLRIRPIDKGLNVDISPTLAYAINRELLTGVGVVYRARFGKTSQNNQPLDVHGLRAFIQQEFFKGFFAYAELEYLSMDRMAEDALESIRTQTTGIIAGVGRTIQFKKKIQAAVYWLYHFDYKNNPAYNTPWQLRVGFQLINQN